MVSIILVSVFSMIILIILIISGTFSNIVVKCTVMLGYLESKIQLGKERKEKKKKTVKVI